MDLSKDLDTLWLSNQLAKSHHDCKPVEILNVHVESAVPKGDNYFSIVARVTIGTLTAAGEKKTYSMIVKKIKTSEQSQKVLANFSMFRNETKTFTNVLSQMTVLMDEFKDRRDTLWPKIYGFVPYTTIALEDLKDRNYVLMDRTGWLNSEQALLVVRGLGRYHAMTKILMNRGLISGDDKGSFWAGRNSPIKQRVVVGGMTRLSKAITERAGAWTAESVELGNRVKKQIPLMCDVLEKIYLNYDPNFEVLNHGDMWTSNILFKLMEYSDVPYAVKFIDFQNPHLNSFIWDVTYFLYVAVKPSVRRVSKIRLLKAYHQSLADNLKFFLWQGPIPSLDDVLNEDKRILPAALAFLATVMPTTSGTTKDAFDMDKLMTALLPEEAYNESVFTEEKYAKGIADDLVDFARAGVI